MSNNTYVYILDVTLPSTSETLDWDVNVDPNFRSQWWRKCEVLSEGEWGRVVRLFYHIFYGEGFVIKPGCSYQRQPDDQPFAGKSKTQ